MRSSLLVLAAAAFATLVLGSSPALAGVHVEVCVLDGVVFPTVCAARDQTTFGGFDPGYCVDARLLVVNGATVAGIDACVNSR